MNDYDMKVHLGFIQGVIDRMAKNSLSCKTWALTLFSALIAVLFNVDKPYTDNYITLSFWIAVITMLIIFWRLDSWYLRLERLFRRLYEAVGSGRVNVVSTYTMSIKPFDEQEDSTTRIMFSYSEGPVYLPLVVFSVAALFLSLRRC